MPARLRSFLVPAALLAAHAALSLWAIRVYSPSGDEPELTAVGYTYWRLHDMRLDPQNPAPPLLGNPLPLLLQPVKLELGREWEGAYSTAFGERLLFWSGNDGDALI